MNYIRHLNGFFDRVVIDDRLNPTHISMYISLFQIWNLNRFNNPISISRSEMMKVSKIHAKATYHKVIKELHEFGFIRYRPSYNPFRGSEIDLIELDEEPVQSMGNRYANRRAKSGLAMNSYRTKAETSTEPMNEPYINNTINRINNKRAYEQSNENTSSNNGGVRSSKKNPNAINHAKDNTTTPGGGAANNTQGEITSCAIPASVSEVWLFFEKEKSSRVEAEKFYNYFQSNGWKVGGRAPMKDWQAAARNWLLNAQKFETKRKSSLHVTTEKDYSEPL